MLLHFATLFRQNSKHFYPETAFFAFGLHSSVGSPPAKVAVEVSHFVVRAAVEVEHLDDLVSETTSGWRDKECHLVGGEELKLVLLPAIAHMAQLYRDQLDIVGLTFMHIVGSGTQLHEKCWTLHFCDVGGERP